MSAQAWTDARAAIKAYIEENWDPTYDPALRYPNEQVDPPESEPWVLVEITRTGGWGSDQNTPGKRVAQISGMVQAGVYYPTGSGDDEAHEIAERFGEMLRSRKIGQVQTDAPTSGNPEQGTDDGKHWLIPIIIPFTITFLI